MERFQWEANTGVPCIMIHILLLVLNNLVFVFLFGKPVLFGYKLKPDLKSTLSGN
jgi:hypothetical protein